MTTLQMPPFHRQGLFWLPDSPSHEVAGTLSWDPEDGLKLELLGFLDKARDDLPWPHLWGSGNQSESSFALVHGVLKEGIRDGTFHGEARWLCLSNCQNMGSLLPSSGIAGESLRPSFAILGNELPSERFDGVYLRSDHLWEWRSNSGFQHERKMKNSRLSKMTMTWTPPEDETVAVEGVAWTIGTGWTEGDQRSEAPRFSEIPYIKAVSARQLTIKALLRELVTPIDSLLTLAFDTPVLHEVWGIQEGKQETEADPKKRYVRILFQRVAKGGSDSRVPRFPLVSPVNFPGGWGALVPAWLNVRESIGDLSGLYFGHEFAPAPFVETRFMMIIQAVEGYHRRSAEFSNEASPRSEHRRRKEAILSSAPLEYRDWLGTALHRSNQPSLRIRLVELARSTQSALDGLIPSAETFATRCAELRNHYAHMIEIRDRPDGTELLVLGMKLRWIFKTRVLMDMGLSTDDIQQGLKANENYQWLRSLDPED